MTPDQFIRTWGRSTLTERSACQQHFLGLCDLLGHPHPAIEDPTGERFTFEKGVKTVDGRQGFADAWKKDFFAWEYKGKHKNLNAAYVQLLQYREALDNPPLLVVCDMTRFVIHTNYTRFAKREYEVKLDDLLDPAKRDLLRKVFFDPDALRPDLTRERVTNEVAGRLADISDGMRGRGIEPHRAARFLTKLVFCLFAEDIGLLKNDVFTRSVAEASGDPDALAEMLADLFGKMAKGGRFGNTKIEYFNGGLFTDGEVVPLSPDEVKSLHEAATYDWGDVDLSIFGTLFERTVDPAKRNFVGSRWTSREDVETLLRPVLLEPLEREWERVQEEADRLWGRVSATKDKAARTKAQGVFEGHLSRFLARLASARVLDPACGSGNFLYVTLALLLNLEKEVITYLSARTGQPVFPGVSPAQILGIELNPFARQIASAVVWIGYLQWQHRNGFLGMSTKRPILGPMTVEEGDAILDTSDPANPREPNWPDTEFIVGNPPFLGTKKLRAGLGDEYVLALFKLYGGRIPNFSDLCCYWFEKSRSMIEGGRARRAGLIATQGIRGGENRVVLKRIKETGDIFFGVGDRDWVLAGASVHISMVGFDNGSESNRVLDGQMVKEINANLTSETDVTRSERLETNRLTSFMADVKGSKFDITSAEAQIFLDDPNPHGRPNSDVIRPWVNGSDITRRGRDNWIIDFGTAMAEANAAMFSLPFKLTSDRVKPEREASRNKSFKAWWLHTRPCPEMRSGVEPLPRFLGTAIVSKHRLFVWLETPTLPDHSLIVFARSDDFFFGVLHSRVHEVWARSQGTQVRERESGFRYTPTTCFETFPFPSGVFAAHRAEVSAAAKDLDRLRSHWLNPPEWTRREVLEFPGSVDGPWRRFVTAPNPNGVGTVHYPRTVPKDPASAVKLRSRTLTNLYNEPPAWLANAHRRLDEAVFAAYGWSPGLTDDELLAKLLALNLERAAAERGERAGVEPTGSKVRPGRASRQ